ncbi:hypothetical protein HAX54_007611 [Datura stramonium]|uniref:Uncharacterized protein n=1 Tax=Datura stramonium TaxID=4076 RepID=A0ABS8TDN4_DATST|nr:hypothetical protein [Datura stramonium]
MTVNNVDDYNDCELKRVNKKLDVQLSQAIAKAISLQQNLFHRSEIMEIVKQPLQRWPNPMSRTLIYCSKKVTTAADDRNQYVGFKWNFRDYASLFLKHELSISRDNFSQEQNNSPFKLSGATAKAVPLQRNLFHRGEIMVAVKRPRTDDPIQ